jgi:hypothetical protein
MTLVGFEGNRGNLSTNNNNMKIITIQKTCEGGGYVACVNGFKNAQCIGKDEISALNCLTEKINKKHPNWIQKVDWDNKTEKN